MKYAVKKSTCEKYEIRWERSGWAIFTIDEGSGLFNCQSDYGDYNYMWPSHGRKSFKHFLIEIGSKDGSYMLNKIADKDHFNFEDSLRQWKKTLIEYRKDGYKKDLVRDAWEFLEGLQDYSGSRDMIINEMSSSSELRALDIEEPWYAFDVDYDYDPSAVQFMKIVMPMFCDVLKKEIDQGENMELK